MIDQNFINALDDLIQTGAKASAALRVRLTQMDPEGTASFLAAVSDAQQVLASIDVRQVTDQIASSVSSAASKAVDQLGKIAATIGDSDTAQTLAAHAQSFQDAAKAAGVGTNWMIVLGVGAGLVAAYFLYQHYTRTQALGTIDRPEIDDRPMIEGMGKALSRFQRLAPSPHRRPQRRLGGTTPKYEFEPEIRLEGYKRRAR